MDGHLEPKMRGSTGVGAGGLCPFCGRCGCRVPVVRSMPHKVQAAYEAAKRYDLATCEGGAAAEQSVLGLSYADVVEARVRSVRTPPPQDPALVQPSRPGSPE